MLEDKNYKNLIRWTSNLQTKNLENEFQILDPYEIARLWGIRRNQPSMNFCKFRRILRHYYNKTSFLKKLPGKRDTYCFQDFDIDKFNGKIGRTKTCKKFK